MTLLAHVVLQARHSGAEILARDLCLEHRRRGLDAAFVSLDHGDPAFDDELDRLRAAGVEVVERAAGPASKPARLRFLTSTLRRLRPDAVLGHAIIPSAYVRLTPVPARRVSVLHDAMRDDFAGADRRLLRAMEPLLRLRTRAVVAVNEPAADAYRRRFGDRVPVHVVPNAIETARFATDPARRRELRAQAGLGDDDRVLLQVARIDAFKNQLRALEGAWSLLDDPGVRLWFAGGIEDHVYADEVLARAGDRAGKQVLLLGSRNDVADLLAVADTLVMPSDGEAHSLAMLEALASGIPIVGSDIPAFAEYASAPGVRLVDPADASAFSGAMRSSLADERCSTARLALVPDLRETHDRYVEIALADP